MKRILLFLLPAFFALQAYSFSDINQYQYKTEIEFIKDQGVVEGYEDGSYRPDQLINRAEFTKIILESVQTQDMEGQKGCFPDVKDQWFARYVCTAKNLAVVK
ncbi:S-layer homology domain-containing protein [Candidatus Venteria ishoeyi]|uniref:Endo-1,4-beta-xylanase A n=1 Tax=Candidatus Venteria ishoeyi TaxID=1899563 RepID=A0A1H6F7Q4_9GAMM|nr:S-layer homology domain-containing protein [Candidatus Venteria ishoeyi]SEH05094.1 Endo-1%2C4-beta-xylanase A precursor [Candidatus Venteria ishoeyi]